MIDIDQIRIDTPAAERIAYLHNAGAALMPTPVVAAMKEHIDLESEIGGYAAADREASRLYSVYGSVGRLLNARPMRSRFWRTRRSPGRWRSMRLRFARAIAS
ncbi:selenocysteine lyase/cysteine desulfurase [Bradyrhizobium diazoefficiens]